MRTFGLAVLLATTMLIPALAEKPPASGAIMKEVVAAFTPSYTKVLIVPPWDYTSDISHQRIATAAIYQHFQYEGFDVLPILAGFTKVAEDKELEPGLPLRKADAVRLGKAAGAHMVVYGEIKELRTYEKESKLIGSKKKICSMRLCVADCENGEVIFWAERTDALGDTGFSELLSRRKTSRLMRVGLQAVTERILADFFYALPKHETKGAKPNDKSLLDLEKATWPDGGD